MRLQQSERHIHLVLLGVRRAPSSSPRQMHDSEEKRGGRGRRRRRCRCRIGLEAGHLVPCEHGEERRRRNEKTAAAAVCARACRLGIYGVGRRRNVGKGKGGERTEHRTNLSNIGYSGRPPTSAARASAAERLTTASVWDFREREQTLYRSTVHRFSQ